MNPRSLLAVPATMLALAAIAAPAVAGSDSDDEDGGPVPVQTQVPVVQAPAPPSVSAPAPIPAPPAPAPEASVKSAPASGTVAAKHRSAGGHKSVRRTARHVSFKTVAQTTTTPRGGVQAGAGGTARDLSIVQPAF